MPEAEVPQAIKAVAEKFYGWTLAELIGPVRRGQAYGSMTVVTKLGGTRIYEFNGTKTTIHQIQPDGTRKEIPIAACHISNSVFQQQARFHNSESVDFLQFIYFCCACFNPIRCNTLEEGGKDSAYENIRSNVRFVPDDNQNEIIPIQSDPRHTKNFDAQTEALRNKSKEAEDLEEEPVSSDPDESTILEPLPYHSTYDNDGYPPLNRAARIGDVDLVTKLIQDGAPIDLPANNESRYTALHEACRYNHINVVKLLLSKGANRSLNSIDGDALKIAKLYRKWEIINLLNPPFYVR